LGDEEPGHSLGRGGEGDRTDALASQREPRQISLVYQLRHRELAGPVDTHEQVELALGGLRLGDLDVQETDRIAFEALTLGLIPLDARQALAATRP